ncbi:hypothetical protein TEA_026906 [Camellia sinensis var. sinensis]|uniref:Uncharacterized protein n=1 Tax=Camellia sinensis var. sinensis TaxID=542762 RepID=A0A4S4DZT4_CAMSN|nr:hypothetical protein TEA_026906 [Camellia sinensis var. sinensis]
MSRQGLVGREVSMNHGWVSNNFAHCSQRVVIITTTMKMEAELKNMVAEDLVTSTHIVAAMAEVERFIKSAKPDPLWVKVKKFARFPEDEKRYSYTFLSKKRGIAFLTKIRHLVARFLQLRSWHTFDNIGLRLYSKIPMDWPAVFHTLDLTIDLSKLHVWPAHILKLWLFLAYVISFVSLAAAVGLLIQDALVETGPSAWTGTAGVLQCVFVLISEPTLVPEWLRSTGSVSGGGNSAHHFAPSLLSDVLSPRSRCSRSVSDKDTPALNQTSSSNSRRSSSSNGVSKHPYSSFSRSHRDILISKAEKDALRRSHSLVCRKPGEVLPRRAVDSKNGGSNTGILSGGILVSSIQKNAFEKDFPSLGTGEKQGVPDIGRVSSPGLSTAVQCLPIGNAGFIGGEGWTSALAEVPNIIGSNSMGPTSVLATPSSGASSSMVGLNMAEALSQAPSKARTTPQLPDKTQRLEELAKKQSRQLIPMTPSMPKGLQELAYWEEDQLSNLLCLLQKYRGIGNGEDSSLWIGNSKGRFDVKSFYGALWGIEVLSSDKSKSKTVVRTSEMIVASKSVQPQPHSSQLANQSLRGGQVRSDASRSSHAGKFLVLKSVWENGVSSSTKDVSSPTNNASRVANSQLVPASVAPSIPLKSPNKLSTVESKVAAVALNSGSCVEKRPSLSQAQSRNDFFNLMRKKTSMNTSSVLPDSRVAFSSPTVEKSGVVVEGVSAPVSPCVTENGSEVTSNGDIHERERSLCLNGAVYPDEEEAAFLRSLGWEENDGEDDGLTEEEINAFYEECMKLRPSLKLCRGLKLKLPMLTESHTTGSSRASSELSLSESETEARIY